MSVKAYDWVAYHARQTPEKLAMVDLHSNRQFSYRDMQERTARLAGALRDEFGVQPGDRVAALLNNSTDCMEMNFACMKLGAIYVPLNWRLTVSELEYIVGDAEPRLRRAAHLRVRLAIQKKILKEARPETYLRILRGFEKSRSRDPTSSTEIPDR